MSSGYHAADDGSLARSTGGAAARGAMLIALALAIGLLLMAFALDDPATEVSASAGDDAADTSDDATDADADAASDDATDADAAADDGASVTVGTPDDDDTTTSTDDATTPTIPEDDSTDVDDPLEEGVIYPAGEVNVLVANGIGGAGVAGGVADKLIGDGYIANPSNAPATAAGVIYYKPGYSANALDVAAILGAAPDAVQPATDTIAVSSEAIADGRLDAAHIIVIIGADNAVPPAA